MSRPLQSFQQIRRPSEPDQLLQQTSMSNMSINSKIKRSASSTTSTLQSLASRYYIILRYFFLSGHYLNFIYIRRSSFHIPEHASSYFVK